MNKQPTTLLQGKPWIPSDCTDVQATWKAHGWKPRAEIVASNARIDVRDSYESCEQSGYLELPGEFRA